MSTPQLPSIDDFQRVKDAANAACAVAVQSRLSFCANKADLHCYDARWVLNEEGESVWLVEIEEASPDDHALRTFIRSELAQQGIAAEVITEW